MRLAVRQDMPDRGRSLDGDRTIVEVSVLLVTLLFVVTDGHAYRR